MNDEMPMKQIIFIIAYILSCLFVTAQPEGAVFPVEITCINVETAGTLESLLTQEQKDTCSQLRIIGQINSADIITLRNMAGENGCLEKLDLSGVSIVASKDPYLQIEDAEKEIMLWAYSVRKKSVNFPGDKRFFYEREVNKNRGWGTPYQNKLYPSSQGRYLSPSPYQVPYRERAYSGGYDDPYYIMGKSNEPISNKRTGICLFEDNLNRVKHGEFIPMRPIRFKGHRLKRKGYSYILSAYTEKDSFCPDMFYHCSKLKQVILPIKASVNERVSVAGSYIKFLEIHTPKY